MNKLWQIISAMLGALSVLFYVSNKSKDRKIEKQSDEIKQKDQKIEEGKFINEQNDKTTVNKNDASNMSNDDIASVYDKNKWFSD